jgi:hypothetical protein
VEELGEAAKVHFVRKHYRNSYDGFYLARRVRSLFFPKCSARDPV